MSIKLSPQHGVNPSVEQCFVCMKDVGVVLFGKMKGDAEAPRQVCLGPSSPPCTECQGHMEKGVIIISVRDGEEPEEDNVGNWNPYRTGGWCVVTDDFIKRVIKDDPELRDSILKKRMVFMPDEVWGWLELPRGEVDG